MSTKKKSQPTPIPTDGKMVTHIRLKPSISDYITFVHTTSGVLSVTGPASLKTKPNELVLSLANLEYLNNPN